MLGGGKGSRLSSSYLGLDIVVVVVDWWCD